MPDKETQGLKTIPRRKLLALGWAVPVILAVKPPSNVFAIGSEPPKPCSSSPEGGCG